MQFYKVIEAIKWSEPILYASLASNTFSALGFIFILF